jgi:phospho-N-acetylmuramoyl-pentapeptide-transferase
MGIKDAIILLVPFLFVLFVGQPYIQFLRKKYFGQYIREDGPQSHQSKKGTPTTGGVLILSGLLMGLIAAYFVTDRSYFTPELWMVVGVTLVLGLLGFSDDYLKISKKHNKGVTGYTKLMIQVSLGLLLGVYMVAVCHQSSVAFFDLGSINLGWFYPIFAAAVVTGTSNAVNLTDGLDGLAASTSIISLLTFAFLFTGAFTNFHAGVYPDLAIVAFALAGATAGFLFFNAHPAKVFMGDTGSLAIGGALGAMGVLGRFELWLFMIGAIFAVETLSVILQVASFKTTGKRIFKMSPLHHHFELSGWHETKVVSAFLIFQILLCVGALFLYNN